MLFFIWCFGRQVDHVTYFHRYFPGAQMASEPHCVTMQSKTETKQKVVSLFLHYNKQNYWVSVV